MTDPLRELFDMAGHGEPARTLTVDLAHTSMRIHRGCTLDTCRRKAAAYRTLVEAGRLVPDSSRQR